MSLVSLWRGMLSRRGKKVNVNILTGHYTLKGYANIVFSVIWNFRIKYVPKQTAKHMDTIKQ